MDQDRAALTILLPLRHYHPAYLRRAVDSILRQTSPHWRMLVIVDAENAPLFRNLLRSDLGDARISLVLNEGRQLPGKLNTGMRHAITEFVAILLGDDMWSPDAVRVLSEHIARHREIDVFHSTRIFIDENDRPLSAAYGAPESFTLADFLDESPAKHLLCWRRSMALAIGGMDESLNSVAVDDWDFPWTMAERGARFMAIREPLYFLRDHRDSFRLSTHLPLSLHVRETKRIMQKHGASKDAIRRRLKDAKGSYLKQCLYRSPFERWLKQLLGYDPHQGWRERYD
jgi:glycosyltransferase involved in cell wall biosynthesis